MNKRRTIIVSCISIILLLVIGTVIFVTSKRDRNDNAFIHISFDDTINVFEDLTRNVESYDSIFDNELLGYLQKLHKRYGAIFSLYCYFQSDDGSFNLTECTDKFASDFQANSSWLKLGFHNFDGNGNLAEASEEQAVSDYEELVGELERITGGGDCIDTYVRLQNFAGNFDAIQGINDLNNGIDGLLSADDERISYYLSEENSEYVANNDYLSDEGNDLIFVSTDLRLENTNNPYGDLIKISKDENQCKTIEVFTHEWQYGLKLKLKLLVTCFWADKYGYRWDFPMNRY